MSLFGTSKPAPQAESADPEEPIHEVESIQSRTVIAKDVVVSGKISGEGAVQIEGLVEGEVSLKGHVTVTSTGRIIGPVEADVIRIAGVVEGSVVCRDHLQLERSGTIEGDVSTVSFVIENGGRLNGRTTMTEARKSEQPAASASFDGLQFGRNYKGASEEPEEEDS